MISNAFLSRYIAFWALLASLGVTAIGYSGKVTLTAVATLMLAWGTFLFALMQRIQDEGYCSRWVVDIDGGDATIGLVSADGERGRVRATCKE